MALTPLGELLVGFGAIGQPSWKVWVRKHGMVEQVPGDFGEVIDAICCFADPVIGNLVDGRTWRCADRVWE